MTVNTIFTLTFTLVCKFYLFITDNNEGKRVYTPFITSSLFKRKIISNVFVNGLKLRILLMFNSIHFTAYLCAILLLKCYN